jgi:DNA-binding response OmpR family regulator
MGSDKSSRNSCLVVDDNYEIFALLAAALPDFSCDYAPDAFTARLMLTKKHFDILLCDIKMPHMDGFDLLEELRKEMVSVPFIFISGMIDHSAVRRAFQLGAANVINKPIDLQELHDKIILALRVHAMADQDDLQSDQEIGYIYNLLKSYYYDIQAILYQIQLYKIPTHIIKDELDKKQRIGKCFLDDPENIKFLNKVA